MDNARFRLDELVAFGAGLNLSHQSVQSVHPSDDISEATSRMFSRGQFDHSKYLAENPIETGNPQVLQDRVPSAAIDRRARVGVQVNEKFYAATSF
jgi:hypothetical protein